MLARSAALLLSAAAVLAACGAEAVPPLAVSCTASPATIVRALQAAPGIVRLSGGTRISECVNHARSDADLQNVGVALSNAAEDLEAPAIAGDTTAALRLGYLVGAADTGAAKTSGIAAELVHRLERSAASASTSPATSQAVRQGMRAGARRG